MKLVLLAAGGSTRLRPLTDDCPKCLLDVGGAPILRRALGVAAARVPAVVDEVVLVTGFLADRITGAVREWFPRLPVTFLHNPDYATTNNAYSLRLTRPRVAGREFVLCDSDIVFEPGVFDLVAGNPHVDCLALRPAADLGDEEIKCELDASGRVLAIGKQVPPARAAGESIGIERFSAATSARLFDVLDDRVGARGLVREYYEASFQELIDGGADLRALSTGSLYCTEIDTLDDLAEARAHAPRV